MVKHETPAEVCLLNGEERGRGQREEGAGFTGASGEEEVGQSYR